MGVQIAAQALGILTRIGGALSCQLCRQAIEGGSHFGLQVFGGWSTAIAGQSGHMDN